MLLKNVFPPNLEIHEIKSYKVQMSTGENFVQVEGQPDFIVIVTLNFTKHNCLQKYS